MMFRRLRNLILILGAITAIVPSLTVGFGFATVPPELQNRFAFVMGFVGLIVFFAVLVARTSLLRLSRPVQIALFCGAAVVGMVLAGWLMFIADASLRNFEDRRGEEVQTIAYLVPDPQDYSLELRRIVVEQYRGQLDAAIVDDPGKMLQLLAHDARPVQIKILILLAAAQAFLVFAVMFGGFAGVKAVGRAADEAL